MKRIRGIGAVAFAGVAVLALSGCQQGSTSSGSDGAEGDAVTLQFQSLSDQPATQAAVKSIVDEWNAENEDVQVEIVQAGWDGTFDKLITQFSGGTAPDIIHYEASSIVSFAADGYLADLSDYIDPDLKSDISEGIWDSVTQDGQIIAYPSTLQSYMVFANADLLEAAGVEIPSGETMTWEELQEIAKATTTDSTYGLGWGLASPTAAMMSLSLGFDGGFFDGEGTDASIQVEDSELAVPERIHEMAYTDKSIEPTSLTQSGSDVLASFYGGKVAMTVQGSFQATNIANDAPEGLNWVALPPLEGSAGAVQAANPQTYSVNVDSEYVEESADFLNFLMNGDNLASIAYADALIPSSGAARDGVETLAADDPAWTQVLASGEGLEGPPFLKVEKYTEWKDTIATPAYQQYLADKITSDELAARLSDGWNDVAG
ncbi:sugar ABC transporter substrate-binding protein [Arthrobacter sp. zg-Y20]|uniref:ABC transporter substrate-binding protein n=1 Tax=unclassified Arthrobacter TaxID=235627 RepID=UPI001D14B6E0|nr:MULTISPECIES: sugar ABC transporter substrate-binding protein [unclassified Arthrobacter]MCC3275375.1 sugar ABC transporter substrate-binding protein [Arthrobacter sp. zg-Y20]MDK1315534.1 sugar ABC transporter substrate-binding protein [Arthrobacter sp. zg.Y20]WIB05949.1 sugar ABC transporter substrate-binding protein [Arthrobacter sp. zg-Y20]